MMTNNDFVDNTFSLLRDMPAILRARDFRLYANGGRRFVDLWQNGGAAILGHTPPAMLRELKNTASRGLYAPFPHFLEKRYIKALSCIFPGRDFRFYADAPPELETLFAAGGAALWRPFLDPGLPCAVSENAAPVLIPVVPGIQGWRLTRADNVPCALPRGLCVTAIVPSFESRLPSGDFLSPVLLAVAARGIYDLIAAAPLRAKPVYPRIANALTKNGLWRRQGLYLTPRQIPLREDWAAIFHRFLENGFLLPPVPFQPAILPGTLSAGEEAKLAGLLSAS